MRYWKTLTLLAALAPIGAHASSPLLEEKFDDAAFSSRGWYDNTSQIISTSEHIPGSKSSLQFSFKRGGTTPTSGGAMRRVFPESESVYLSYHIKYSSNWVGSGKSYHPHQFYFLTNQDDKWSGLAETHMTAYIEDNGGRLQFVIQDTKNVDQRQVNKNLVNTTENRGIAGCNGDSDGHGAGDCYNAGGLYRNGKAWRAKEISFSSSPGENYKADWHQVETFIKLNSIVNGKGVADGVIQMWVDGRLIMNHTDIMLRTGQQAQMRFNQLAIGPYIGDGSPVDQSFWVDDLVLARERPTGTTAKPSPPSNVRVAPRH